MNKHEAEQESASETEIRMCGWALLKMAEEKKLRQLKVSQKALQVTPQKNDDPAPA